MNAYINLCKYLTFREGKMMGYDKKSILVFAPHPDDETLGCGGTIAKRFNEGYEVIVVVLTDGQQAFYKVFGINSDPTPEELKQIRKEEAIRAIKTLGLSEKNIVFLDFEDGSVKKYEEEVSKKILEIINTYSPIEVYFPYAKDHNPDHKITNRIVKLCIKKSGLSPKKFQFSIMQEHARIRPFLDKLINLFRKHMIEVDTSDFISLKRKAVEQYKSQISIISKKQTKPIISKERIKRYLRNKELFYKDKD
jgi:LmbE family N-acetylglucosaminyl deacetylase